MRFIKHQGFPVLFEKEADLRGSGGIAEEINV